MLLSQVETAAKRCAHAHTFYFTTQKGKFLTARGGLVKLSFKTNQEWCVTKTQSASKWDGDGRGGGKLVNLAFAPAPRDWRPPRPVD